MPKRNNGDETPQMLRPFVSHGVDFSRTTGSEVEGNCPFCGKTKLYVKAATGEWDCKTCDVQGNVYTFLRRVWSASYAPCPGDNAALVALSEERGIPSGFLQDYGLCRSCMTGDWLVPAYGTSSNELVNLYRYKQVSDRRTLIPTPSWTDEPHHGYFRPVNPPESYERLDICEGVWDAAAWRYALSTTNSERLDRTLVIGTPGCKVWQPGWGKLASGKVVTVMFDNDHPHTNPNSGTTTQPALSGVKRVCEALGTFSEPPAEIHYLSWSGNVEQYHDVESPDGHDIRDLLCDGGEEQVMRFVGCHVRSAPSEWTRPPVVHAEPVGPKAESCSSWSELVAAWKDAICYTTEFETALVFALSVASAVEYGRTRLWGKLIGVGSTGKSTICDALTTAHGYVVSESVINGFYSGARTEDGKDHSFIARLYGMLWVNNDGDTLLRNPNREKVLAELRDLYGGNGSRVYYNGLGSRKYCGVKFGVLIAGTTSLWELDSAELGGRFLDFYFRRPDDETKRRIAIAAIRQQTRCTSGAANMTLAIEKASKMTGGYLSHLRTTQAQVTPDVSLTEPQEDKCYHLADFVAHMRSRPSKTQEEQADSTEMPTRLAQQLSTLAVFASFVRGRDKIDLSSMSLVRRVAADTCRGRTQAIVSAIADCGRGGLDMRGITRITGNEPDSEYERVSFLTRTGVLEAFDGGLPSIARATRWRLTDRFSSVYRAVYPSSSPSDRSYE